MTRSALEDAVRAWVLAASGLAADKVLFAHQNGVSPVPGPAAIISLGDLSSVGLDETSHTYDVSRPAGQEIEYTAAAVVETIASVSLFTRETVGDSSAMARAERCRVALSLPSVRDALNAAGVGVMAASTVRWVPEVDGARWQGQAVLEVRLVLRQTATERTGYISSVEFNQTTTE